VVSQLPVHVTGDGRQSRSNTYVDDAVDALVRACVMRPEGAVLNIAGGEEVALLDAVRMLGAALEVDVEVQHGPARSGDQRVTRTRADRALDVLGWRPATCVADSLACQALSARRARADRGLVAPSA
jgi:nucleoside-diphosphate-sugar epimerase